jgi:hypothetical protein
LIHVNFSRILMAAAFAVAATLVDKACNVSEIMTQVFV